jgi:hypothetical protein
MTRASTIEWARKILANEEDLLVPGKSANVKNEKKYEKLKVKGMSKKRSEDRELCRRIEARRREEWIWRRQLAGRHHRTEEEGGQKGRHNVAPTTPLACV